MHIESDIVRINISSLAEKIINQDFQVFSILGTHTLNGFINQMIKLYTDNSCEAFSLNLSLAKIKFTSKRYRLNKGTIQSLQRYFYDTAPNGIYATQCNTLSMFIKLIIETYVRLPFIQRERFILSDSIDKIEKAISKNQMLTVKTFNSTHKIAPYSIIPSRENVFSYLIGYTENGAIKAIRISQIKDLSPYGKRKLPNEKILNEMNDRLAEYGATFIEEDLTDIQIQFITKQARQSYEYSIIHRPVHTKILDDEKNVFLFRCSLKQAKYFFFRFTGEVKILQPVELRKWFLEQYKAGLNANE